MYLCFTSEYQIVVLICYAFHVVSYFCSLYHFSHLVAFEINIHPSIYSQRAAELAKRHKGTEKKYFASVEIGPNCKSEPKLLLTVVVLGAIGKTNIWNKVTKGRPLYNAYLYLAIITLHIVDVHLTCLYCLLTYLLYLLSVTRSLAAITRLHFSISATEKNGYGWGRG